MISAVIIRPVAENDLEDLFSLAVLAGPGMTNLPSNKKTLKKKIEWSLESFQKKPSNKSPSNYFFVMECLLTHKVVGCCGVFSEAGGDYPFFSYKVVKEELFCQTLNIKKEIKILHLVTDYQKVSEIGMLFLSPEYRKNHNGDLLSRIRFLFMAEFKKLFSTKVIAEMRGFIDENGISSFWEGLGRHFFEMDFDSADRLCAEGNKQFIMDFLPRHPIYVSILSKKAQEVIGQVHPKTKPALHLLNKEGFTDEGYIDIFDGGVTVECLLNNISSVKNSEVKKIKINDFLVNSENSVKCLISNNRLDFRGMVDFVNITNNEGTVSIFSETAKHLHVSEGQEVRIVRL